MDFTAFCEVKTFPTQKLFSFTSRNDRVQKRHRVTRISSIFLTKNALPTLEKGSWEI